MRELGRADLTEEVADVERELSGLEPVVDAIAVATLADQISSFQDREVARDRGTRDVEATRDGAGGQLPVLQFLKDLAACRIGQGAEDASGILHRFAI